MGNETAKDRAEQAREMRTTVPRSAHGAWAPAANRSDPVEILTGQDASRLQWLVPVRHARMTESAFAFYRGGAAIMAADLAGTPSMGVDAQLCGDAHLANFGSFASAERRQVFDVNDFDETLPGPWEWDVKRLAASMVVAARDNGLGKSAARDAAQASVRAYQDAMGRFAQTPALQVWYAQLSLDQIRSAIPRKSDRKAFDKAAGKARSKNSQRALGKLTETVDGQQRIRSQPPLLIPLRELAEHVDRDNLRAGVEANFSDYVQSLPMDRRQVLHRFSIVDMALKVVGVGSVGTRCWIVLLRGRDHGEPLFLQVKEASASVLEAYLAPSQFDHPGERVVNGRRLMQASSDIFLGWSGSADGSHFYWRQFHDMKGSADVAAMDSDRLVHYGQVCGWTLAHAHARSGDSVAIAAYLGSGKSFSRGLTDFAVAYANQNQADYEAFQQAIADGRIEAHEV
jgi:uncharacterized protein (DUF2252 family)